jgi:hypothetical protein
MTMICPALSHAAIIYSNEFESGLQPRDFGPGGDEAADDVNGFCSRGGTGLLLGHTGCPSVVPTGSINAGNGDFVAFATPGQTGSGGSASRGSTLGFSSTPLVDGYHGRYEFSFTGSGVRELVFVDQVWTPFGFSEDAESPFGGAVPSTFEGGDLAGTSVSIANNRYSVTFDLDERTRFFDEFFPPNTGADGAIFSICGTEVDQSSCALRWTFAIDNDGWLDDIELNYLGLGGKSTQIPEPGTLVLVLTGLVAAATMRGRRNNW